MPIERPSDRHYPCFFCLDSTSKRKEENCPNCGKPLDFGNDLVGQNIDGLTLVEYVSRGHYGAVYRSQNRIGRDYALKLVPISLYETAGKEFNGEISKYIDIGQHPNIASLENAGEVSVFALDQKVDFYFIVMEWIEGVTLTDFTKGTSRTPNEIISVLFDVSAALERFEDKNLWHNDLNSDNILIQHIDKSQSLTRKHDSPFVCKVVDTGSAVFRGVKDSGRMSDLKFLAFHINELQNAAIDTLDECTREERFLNQGISVLVSRLFDENEQRSIVSAKSLVKELESLHHSRLLISSNQMVELEDPFGYLNASELPPGYINLLFASDLPWIQSISSPESKNTLITGPRGCGKTMLLRSMSLNTKMLPTYRSESASEIQARLLHDTYIAFFVSARINIGNHCSFTRLPKWAESEQESVLYFTLLYLSEILETVERGQVSGVWSIDSKDEGRFCNFISSNLGLENYGSISALSSLVKKLQHTLIREDLSKDFNFTNLGPAFFSGLASQLTELCVNFSGKQVVFLLDDFSRPKVPVQVQKSLLPIIFNIGGGYSFRVSAHSESTEKQDVRNNQYEINREFREINLGGSYLEATASTQSMEVVDAFVEDIFTKRFELSKDHKGANLQDLLGRDNENPIGQRLRSLHLKKAARTFRYHGRKTVLRLCSGDVSYLIDMVGKISRQADAQTASINTQHNEIRQYAWKQLYSLKDTAPSSGIDLFQIALAFGKLSRFKLVNLRRGKDENSPPEEYLKIEVELDQAGEAVTKSIADLLQHGVFVDGGFSNSSKGAPTRKLFFRKIFTPAFPTTYNSGNTFPMTASTFEFFMTKPDDYLRNRVAEDGIGPSDQPSLLDQLAQTVDSDDT